jgi:ribulose-5-phosphate 4-epimerase/fuculose-1-phosphate aldolase
MATVRSDRSSVADDATEWGVRTDLAAAFRLASHLGWNDGLGNHITARLPNAPDKFLMNPRPLGWHEIRASDLVRLSISGANDKQAASSVGPAGLNFHRAIPRLARMFNAYCTRTRSPVS